MKINGTRLSSTPYEEIVVIPRGSEEKDIVITVRAVLDYKQFDEVCPGPKPPMIQKPGQPFVPNYESPKYKEDSRTHWWRRRCWMVLKSLQATPGLEFETVKWEDPASWELWEQEFAASGFTVHEITTIVEAIRTVNGMSEEKMEAARKRFLSSRPTEPPAP